MSGKYGNVETLADHDVYVLDVTARIRVRLARKLRFDVPILSRQRRRVSAGNWYMFESEEERDARTVLL